MISIMNPRAKLDLLYFSQGSMIDSCSHFHSFHQLEICTRGELHGICGERRIRLQPGHFWLIPPEMPHHFTSYSANTEYFSLKFDFSGYVGESTLYDEVTRYFVGCLLELLNQERTPSPCSREGRELIELALMSLLNHIRCSTVQEKKQESEFMMDLKEEICRQGYRVNVNELAEFCHSTRSQFRYRFSKESEWRGTIKEYIDHVLFEIAESHLKYSNMNFSRIAKVMNFPDLSVFSRFIRKYAGVPPSQFRKFLQNPLTLEE